MFTASVTAISERVAYKLMQYYPGNKTGGIPGIFGEPIFWVCFPSRIMDGDPNEKQWQAGAVFGGLIDYWHYTGDSGYNKVTTEAILWQVGDDWDFMPKNQSHTLVRTSSYMT
jgi:mannan endo-1,6-alpha-mannosidase